jgi:hypothetical protein
MSKFPVESNDSEGMRDAVNYLLSGPGGLGQDFAGFNDYEDPWARNAAGDPEPKVPAYLTGNFRAPFTQTPAVAKLFVSAIGVSNAEQIDSRTVKYYFAGAPLASVPFAVGNGLTIYGITPSTFNSSSLRNAGSSIGAIGVIECTTSYVIVRTRAPIETPLGTYVSGGNIEYSSTDIGYVSTDCNARVAVTGGTEKVVVGGQLDQIISYECFDPTVDFQVTVSINRYNGFPTNDPVNPEFLFDVQYPPVVSKTYTFTGLSGTGTLPMIETVFTPVIDQPPPGYYWYILEVRFDLIDAGYVEVTQDEFRLRSLLAQSVKQ